MIKTLPIEALSPGMMVISVVEQNGPVKIRKIGVIRSNDMIKGLKEMGVRRVEVDLSQSVEVESPQQDLFDSSAYAEPPTTNNNKVAESSATKKLIASRQHQATGEQNVSQKNQYRALFVPSEGESNLKWSLYSNPQITLCLLVIIGALLGFGGSYAFYEYNAYQDALVAQQNSLTEQQVSAQPTNTQNLNSTSTNNLNANNQQQINKNAGEGSDLGNSSQNTNLNNSAAGNVNSNQSIVQNNTAQSNDSNSANSAQTSEAGVMLEDGQVVLGYRPGQDTEEEAFNPTLENDVALNSSTQSSSQDDAAPLNEDLLQRIKDAAEEVDNRPSDSFDNLLNVTDLTALPRIDQLPQNLLAQMPSMSFSAHMYASNPQDRWVRVNSRRVGEGEYISNNLILKKIEAEQVILDFRGTEFTMNALSDW